MRQLRTGGPVIAFLALLGLATACGSAPVSVTGALDTAVQHGAAVQAKPGAAAVKHADLLYGVSCVGTQCVAVGGWYYGTKNGEHTLVELWTGKAWVLEPSPAGPKVGALDAVSCAAGASGTEGAAGGAAAGAAGGVAAGAAGGAATSAGCLALGTPTITGYGSRWRTISAPTGLNAVSCTSPDACLAVAGVQSSHTPVFATWNGTTWHTGTMHAPPPQGQPVSVTIASVSCTTADNCVAVGDYAYPITAQPSPNYRDKTLAEQWNGRSWRLLPTVNVSHVNALSGVSCASADDCTAVGTNQGQYGLAEHWNGTTWRAESVPTVSSIGYLNLTSVSCPAADFCVAAGTYQIEPVAETWNGTKWRLTQLPEPPGAGTYGVQLPSVSCVSSRACAAVGTDFGTVGSFAELYAAGKWRVSATRNPT